MNVLTLLILLQTSNSALYQVVDEGLITSSAEVLMLRSWVARQPPPSCR